MDAQPPALGATLRFRQLGTYDGDDDVYLWTLPDGRVLVEVRGPRAVCVEMRAGDVVEVVVREAADGGAEDTEVSLLRDGLRTPIASGTITLTVGGMHGPTLAAELRACCPREAAYEVKLVRSR